MNEIKRLYPAVNFDLLRELADLVVNERNLVAECTKLFSDSPWGFGCLACEAVKKKVERAEREGTYSWLEYVQEAGMAYTVKVAGVPLRIQPDVDDIRDVQPGERSAIATMCQAPLFVGEIRRAKILRLEITQRPAKPVELATLYLFEEVTGITLDTVVLYRLRSEDGDGTAAIVGGPSNGSPPASTVIPLARPAQDADTSGVFEFPEAETAHDADHGRD